jgi:hypothetical protein
VDAAARRQPTGAALSPSDDLEAVGARPSQRTLAHGAGRVLEHSGERYLVSYRGESDWARNPRGRLAKHGRVEEIDVAAVAVAERAALLEIYSARYGRMPTVAATLRALPDPADHPIFRITDATPAM